MIDTIVLKRCEDHELKVGPRTQDYLWGAISVHTTRLSLAAIPGPSTRLCNSALAALTSLLEVQGKWTKARDFATRSRTAGSSSVQPIRPRSARRTILDGRRLCASEP
jgi:hypothetical protein